MRYHKHPSLVFFFLLLCCCMTGYGQKNVKGAVMDAVTGEPLPYVSIKIKNFDRGTTSNDVGNFSIQTNLYDTLVFSCIGYSTTEIPVKASDELWVVRMEESSNVLKMITVYNSVTPGFKNIPKESKFRNQAANVDYGYGILQTFGPGYTIKSPISRFLKTEKEKKRLLEIQKDNSKAKNYIDIVGAPDVKDELIKKYALSEREYYDILAKFNQVNQRSMYGLDRKSLVHSIFVFFENDITTKNKSAPSKD